MKKITIFIMACLFVSALPSCRKDYTCICTAQYSMLIDTIGYFSTGKTSKKNAKAKCDERDKEFSNGSGTITTECEIF